MANFKIAVASGKGGTGKTTLAVNLFNLLAIQEKNRQVHLLDCDVEEPNALLFFSEKSKIAEQIVNQAVPFIDNDLCVFCGKCSEYCEFNAISIINSVRYAKVDESLCHSCGACLVACKHQAIRERDVVVGMVSKWKVSNNSTISEGRLKVGSAMQTYLIKQLKHQHRNTEALCVFDAPPGTSCAVVETVSDADFVILVAEPTPFGLYDFKLMVELLREMKKPFGVVVNKWGIGDSSLEDFVSKENLILLGRLPFSLAYAANYAQGKFLHQANDVFSIVYLEIYHFLKKIFDAKRDNNC